jgi:recombinational DNA repair ATPase RecF
MAEREARRVASAGERKALGLLLLAAQARLLARRGRRPLLLLDDADTELDSARLMAVWTALGEPEQLLATSNRPEVWAALPLAGRFCVEAGEVVRG